MCGKNNEPIKSNIIVQILEYIKCSMYSRFLFIGNAGVSHCSSRLPKSTGMCLFNNRILEGFFFYFTCTFEQLYDLIE